MWLTPSKPLVKTGGFFMLAFLLLGLGGCALLRDMAKPEVTLTSVSLGASSGLTQMLNLGVKVRNLNTFALTINRLNYRIFLEDSEVASGRRGEVLTIEGNDSVSFTVPVELNLLSGLSLAQKLLKSPKNELAYRMEIDADVANFGLGLMKIRKESTIKFDP